MVLDKNYLIEAVEGQRRELAELDNGVTRDRLVDLKAMMKNPFVVVITGLRRSGKSTLLRQMITHLVKDNYYYVNFEDERLSAFSVGDFSLLEQSLIELYGKKSYYLFDEVQNVIGWERFVRRLADQGKKVIVTGSNASLLSKELGTKLTGRYLALELYPFSFKEFVTFKRGEGLANPKTIEEKAVWGRYAKMYLKLGGVPGSLKYPKVKVLSQLYQDILYRDVIARYGIDSVRAIRDFTQIMISSTADLVSFNKIKDLLKVSSVTTLTNYVTYLENAWLVGIVNKFAYSVKTQQIASKKVYAIDTGLVNQVGFSFSPNWGKLLETVVYWNLRRLGKDVYYYQTKTGKEVDFYIPADRQLIQVCWDMADKLVEQREAAAINEAVKELGAVKAKIVTMENFTELI